MKLHTASDSVYELDESRKRIRRLSGNGDPTRRTGQDGAWREYESIQGACSSGEIQPGFPVLITWPVPGTLTSRILRVDP